MSKHRASHRLARRRARVSGLAMALGVTVAVGGAAVGAVPQLRADSASADAYRSSGSGASSSTGIATSQLPPVPTPSPSAADVEAAAAEKAAAKVAARAAAEPPPPAGSGEGRRIVFDQSDQRVWLVEDGEKVARTYLVSGSRFDNLQPGSYTVSSRSRYATSFDYTGKLEYFVRFATGFSAPIGFHAVPRYNNGELEQTKAQLGTPLSAGCVRQWMPDAIALWDFAPIGTRVFVTA